MLYFWSNVSFIKTKHDRRHQVIPSNRLVKNGGDETTQPKERITDGVKGWSTLTKWIESVLEKDQTEGGEVRLIKDVGKK